MEGECGAGDGLEMLMMLSYFVAVHFNDRRSLWHAVRVSMLVSWSCLLCLTQCKAIPINRLIVLLNFVDCVLDRLLRSVLYERQESYFVFVARGAVL